MAKTVNEADWARTAVVRHVAAELRARTPNLGTRVSLLQAGRIINDRNAAAVRAQRDLEAWLKVSVDEFFRQYPGTDIEILAERVEK